MTDNFNEGFEISTTLKVQRRYSQDQSVFTSEKNHINRLRNAQL